MALTDFEFYSQTYSGAHSQETITPYLKEADDIIGCCICRAPLSDDDKNICRYAACIQADDAVSSRGADCYTSVKLGDFSLSGGKSADGDNILCDRAAAFLESKGLLYRGGISL